MPNETLETVRAREVRIRTGSDYINADLAVPPHARGIVVFAHGSGSSRFSPRNRGVAAVLQRSGFATLLADLLTPEEDVRDELTSEVRFDVALLGRRVADITDWLAEQPETRGLPVGYFGASTGAAAALIAAAERPHRVRAVVSRGGRPDLAGPAAANVRAPTLLIVGERDSTVVALNRGVLPHLPTGSAIEIVPGATHLFPEPFALQVVTRLATAWFANHLSDHAAKGPEVAAGGVNGMASTAGSAGA
jgi:dienelactone hydrolase